MDDALEDDAPGTDGKQDQIAAQNRLAKAEGQIIPPAERLRMFGDPGADAEQFVDERDGAPRIVGGDEVAGRLQILDRFGA